MSKNVFRQIVAKRDLPAALRQVTLWRARPDVTGIIEDRLFLKPVQ